MTRLLRLAAFAIAVAGVIDPGITISGAARARIALVSLDPSSSAAALIRDRLTGDLSASYEIVPAVTSDAAAAIVIGDRYPDRQAMARLGSPLPDALLVATVTTAAASTNAAHIVSVDAPRDVPPATAIHIEAVIESRNMTGQTTDAVVLIGGLEVGRASHKWTADGERWRASIDAVPVGDPPYVLQVRLPPSPDGFGATGKPDTTPEASAATASVVSGFSRTSADLVVGLRRDPIRVEFYDPRPSWATTFIRRALEADPRFQVSTLSFTSRGIATQSGDAVPLGDARLDIFDAVIVGGLDRVSAVDARALDRYMRERGGAVVVIPDQRIDTGPARDLIASPAEAGHYPPDLVERLLEQPAKLTTLSAASLQASELLVIDALPAGADVVARLPGPEAQPVIVSSPRGDGRLLFSGAMDAWRYRAADGGAFDRFWQSTIAGLALAVPPPIAIDIDPPLLRPGEDATVIARIRSREADAVSASVDGEPIRLLPDPETGVYRGRFVSRSAAGRSSVEVRAGQTRQTRIVLVQPHVQRIRPAALPLSMLAASHRGVDVTPEHLTDLEGAVRRGLSVPRVPFVRHPMRSIWWILPFAGCLSAEWWLRRRRGLR